GPVRQLRQALPHAEERVEGVAGVAVLLDEHPVARDGAGPVLLPLEREARVVERGNQISRGGELQGDAIVAGGGRVPPLRLEVRARVLEQLGRVEGLDAPRTALPDDL